MASLIARALKVDARFHSRSHSPSPDPGSRLWGFGIGFGRGRSAIRVQILTRLWSLLVRVFWFDDISLRCIAWILKELVCKAIMREGCVNFGPGLKFDGAEYTFGEVTLSGVYSPPTQTRRILIEVTCMSRIERDDPFRLAPDRQAM